MCGGTVLGCAGSLRARRAEARAECGRRRIRQANPPSFARSCHGGLLGAALSARVMLCCSAFSPRAPSRPPGGDEPAIARSDSCAPPPQVCPRGIASHSSAGWRVRHRLGSLAKPQCMRRRFACRACKAAVITAERVPLRMRHSRARRPSQP